MRCVNLQGTSTHILNSSRKDIDDKDERYIILHGYHYRCYNFIKYT